MMLLNTSIMKRKTSKDLLYLFTEWNYVDWPYLASLYNGELWCTNGIAKILADIDSVGEFILFCDSCKSENTELT